MKKGLVGYRYCLTFFSSGYRSLISAKTLRKAYCDIADKLRDTVTDLNNERILNRALGHTNQELKSKFEELQRSVVSLTPHRRLRPVEIR